MLELKEIFRKIKSFFFVTKYNLYGKKVVLSIPKVGLVILVTSIFVLSFAIISPNSIESQINIVDHTDVAVDTFLSEYFQSDFTGVGSGTEIQDSSIITGLDLTHYTIKNGDTLGKIAQDNKISLGTLISYNSIRDVRRLIPGKDLVVPNLDGVLHKVKAGESIESIATKYAVNVNKIIDGNNLESDILKKDEKLFIPGGKLSDYELKSAIGNLVIWPCSGRITSYYGYRNDPFTGRRSFHRGVDVANYKGAPIKAAMSGRVISVHSGQSGYGKYIVVKHSNGFQTLYGHLNKQYVKNGQWVEQGQTIGAMGNTGRSTGTHCHFTMYKYGKLVNPMLYLSGRP